MATTHKTGLNNIPTDDQNYLCAHWPESRRVLKILEKLLDDPEASRSAAQALTDGERAVRLLQKGQPARKRSLYTHGTHDGRGGGSSAAGKA